jgi:predicted Zn-ribbon and HTH transcriptional regulator
MEDVPAHTEEPWRLSDAALDLVRLQTGIEIDAWRESMNENENERIVSIFWSPSGSLHVVTDHSDFFYGMIESATVCKVRRRSSDDVEALVECIMAVNSFARRLDDGIIHGASSDRCANCGFETHRRHEMILHFVYYCPFCKIKSALKV